MVQWGDAGKRGGGATDHTTLESSPESAADEGDAVALPTPLESSRPGESSRDRHVRLLGTAILVGSAVFAMAWISGAMVAGGVFGCESCHAMRAYAEATTEAGHATVTCAECHTGDSLVAATTGAPRAWRWIESWSLGRAPTAQTAADTACRMCHESVTAQLIEAQGIRVRHSDFDDVSCTVCHSGTGHRLSDRLYLSTQMSDCTSCHRTSAVRVESCEQCHVGDADRSAGASAWRAVHGAGWRDAHGMGDLDGCTDCHTPAYCADCHGVALPHPAEWSRTHGGSAAQEPAACESCHQARWCRSCHGMAMPHPEGFIAEHPIHAETLGYDTCYRCHTLQTCESCHVQSSHPAVEGVRTDAHGGAR